MWRRSCVGLILVSLVVAGGAGWFLHKPSLPQRPLTSAEQMFRGQLAAAGAGSLRQRGDPDGGTRFNGLLEGRSFALAVPPNWNHEALIFAGGYSIPGSALTIPEDPIAEDPSKGLLSAAYRDGFAVAYSAFDKSGIGVESGVRNSIRLRDFLARAGTRRFYMSGGSMGGSIVMGVIDTVPQKFSGALAACGVVDSWEREIGDLIDLRATYNYLTAGTKYALPGDTSVARNGLSPAPPFGISATGDLWRFWQLKRAVSPVQALFDAAKAHPQGHEAEIIRNLASVSGVYRPEILSIATPLATALMAMDDIKATYGGIPYDNSRKIYRSRFFNDAQNAALNRGIERVHGDAVAFVAADRWHRSTGLSPVPLVTIHNAEDSLVSHDQQDALIAKMRAKGNGGRILAYTAPTQYVTMPGLNIRGFAHCGFTPVQMQKAWRSLRQRVETGRR